jgi:rhamnulokinase
MPTGEKYVAFDLGAESGRTMLGTLDNGRLRLEEIHRFSNTPVPVLDSLHWNVLHLWREMKQGLSCIASQHGPQLEGIAVDAWAQDFALLDQNGALLGLPHHYRDSRTEGILDELHELAPDWEIYQLTGMPGFAMSTLGQLMSMRRQHSPALDAAHTLLLMPGLFTFWLSGRQVNEASIAGMTQLYDLTKRDWNRTWLERLNLPAGLPAPVVPTATPVGSLLSSVAQEVGTKPAPVIATAGHDTAAAAAIVPGQGENVTFISSGTWSVLGKELSQPILTPQAMASGFLNEVGACDRVLFAYNSTGLWPLQECRRHWLRAGHNWSYADLTEMAGQSPPFAAVVDPDDSIFMRPGDIMARIADFCRRTRQEMPPTPGGIVRSFLEGLALRYRKAIQALEMLIGQPTEVVHIVGGGCKNALLCQLAADATSLPVVAGPAEATASGNVLLQALARGSLSSLSQVKEVVTRSCDLTHYEPQPSAGWDADYETFLRIVSLAGQH